MSDLTDQFEASPEVLLVKQTNRRAFIALALMGALIVIGVGSAILHFNVVVAILLPMVGILLFLLLQKNWVPQSVIVRVTENTFNERPASPKDVNQTPSIPFKDIENFGVMGTSATTSSNIRVKFRGGDTVRYMPVNNNFAEFHQVAKALMSGVTKYNSALPIEELGNPASAAINIGATASEKAMQSGLKGTILMFYALLIIVVGIFLLAHHPAVGILLLLIALTLIIMHYRRLSKRKTGLRK